ncbi:hypothetical protein KC331_g2040 [Hortaea werneckii]|nr:hypothetical protein KC331_g2040 [Hortaea werneckii]KAI7721038.1 hypothetical protein KC353_g1699 [Hortaea werneckii]
MSDLFELLSSTNSGSEGEEMDGGMSAGGGAEATQSRKAQSAFSTKDKEEIYCGHIVQPRIPNEFGKEEVSPDCPSCKLRQQLPLDKKLAAQQIMDKKKAREELLEQAASLATDIANLEEYRRERQQERKDLLEVVFDLQDQQEAWDKEQARLPIDQRTERNVFDEHSLLDDEGQNEVRKSISGAQPASYPDTMMLTIPKKIGRCVGAFKCLCRLPPRKELGDAWNGVWIRLANPQGYASKVVRSCTGR